MSLIISFAVHCGSLITARLDGCKKLASPEDRDMSAIICPAKQNSAVDKSSELTFGQLVTSPGCFLSGPMGHLIQVGMHDVHAGTG